MIPLHRLLSSLVSTTTFVSSALAVLCNEVLQWETVIITSRSGAGRRTEASYTTKNSFMGLKCPFLLCTCHAEMVSVRVDGFPWQRDHSRDPAEFCLSVTVFRVPLQDVLLDDAVGYLMLVL